MVRRSWWRRLLLRFPPIAWRDRVIATQRDEVVRLRAELSRVRRRKAYLHDRLKTSRAAHSNQLQRAKRDVSSVKEQNAQLRADITELGKTLTALQDRYDRLVNTDTLPSLRSQITSVRRGAQIVEELDPRRAHPMAHMPHKLATRRLAQSHGIEVATLLAVWPQVSDIDLSGLPDRFVLKADGGAGGRGVLPLQRISAGRYALIGTDAELSEGEIQSRLGMDRVAVRAPYFAEELLFTRDGRPIPDDVKFYSFYGEIGQIVLIDRMSGRHPRYRYVDGTGADLGQVGERAVDASVRVPESLPEMVAVARHLSRASGLPFCRVDLYETVRGPVLGEITLAPGGSHVYRSEHTQMHGHVWERARIRLDLDLAAGRPFGDILGPHAAPDPYPLGSAPWSSDSGPTPVNSCDQWCTTPHAAAGE